MQRLSKIFAQLLYKKPQAAAVIRGSARFPNIKGLVRFYQTHSGVLIATEVFGLPTARGMCDDPVFGFHIHSGGRCSGNAQDPFADAMTHYAPDDCPHPYHAGDMPPLFGVNGYAFSVFVSGRVSVKELLGKTVIIHARPDDFTTQPAGNAGEKLACGVIKGG